MSHKPDGRLPLLSARPAVTLTTLKRAATNFAAWWTEAWWVWTVCLRLLPDSVQLRFEPRPFRAWVQHANNSATEPPVCIVDNWYYQIQETNGKMTVDFITLCVQVKSQNGFARTLNGSDALSNLPTFIKLCLGSMISLLMQISRVLKSVLPTSWP